VVVPPSGTGASSIGEYCKVTVALHPVDSTAPDILMQVGCPRPGTRRR
jgi:hypothetical protein